MRLAERVESAGGGCAGRGHARARAGRQAAAQDERAERSAARGSRAGQGQSARPPGRVRPVCPRAIRLFLARPSTAPACLSRSMYACVDIVTVSTARCSRQQAARWRTSPNYTKAHPGMLGTVQRCSLQVAAGGARAHQALWQASNLTTTTRTCIDRVAVFPQPAPGGAQAHKPLWRRRATSHHGDLATSDRAGVCFAGYSRQRSITRGPLVSSGDASESTTLFRW